MVWLALAVSLVSLTLSLWTILRCCRSAPSHIEIAPKVVQAGAPPTQDAAWQRFEVHHRPAFERALAEQRKRVAEVRD